MTSHALHLPFTQAELRQLCKEMANLSPVVFLDDYRVLIHQLGFADFTQHHAVSEHEHAFYEAHIVLNGEGQVEQSNLSQDIMPGSLLVFEPHVWHSWQTVKEPYLSFVIWFDVSPAISLTPLSRWSIRPDLIQEIGLLFRDVSEGEIGWNHQVTARLTIILSKILARAKWQSRTVANAADHPVWLVKVIDQYLADNLAEKVTLDDIAVHLSSSVRRLTRDYRRLTGKSIMERMMELRMIRAAALLQEPGTIAAIGDQVGIHQPSYFCHCFNKIYGMSPGDFRRIHAKQLDLTPPKG